MVYKAIFLILLLFFLFQTVLQMERKNLFWTQLIGVPCVLCLVRNISEADSKGYFSVADFFLAPILQGNT